MPLLILIAEDDPRICLSISDYLELSGYSVITAKNGKKARSMVDRYHPHLLVSAIKIPEKDGYELVKNIRQLPLYRLLPVILLAECGDTTERIRGYQAGCDLYLAKPFEMEELGAIVRNLLERAQIIHSELRFAHGDNNYEAETNHNLPVENQNAVTQFNQRELHKKLKLTSREKEVLMLLRNAHSNIEIGQRLQLSHRTIEKYVSSLLRKSERNNRIELIRLALEYNI